MADINGIPYVEATDLVSAYPGTSLALATELDTQLAAKSALASPTFTGTPAAPTAAVATNTTQIATTAFVLANTGGKILQIVRATDATTRSTTSLTFVDVTGMAVTITPQKSDSALLIIATFRFEADSSANNLGFFRLVDASDNAIAGAENVVFGQNTSITERAYVVVIGHSTPATTSAVTHKLQVKAFTSGQTTSVNNASVTGQMFAIEVSA